MQEDGDDTRGRALAQRDLDAANLNAPTRALLEFAGKVTEEAYKITDRDIERLRELGWRDAQVAECVLDAALFNMLDRVADAFGITHDEEEVQRFSPLVPARDESS